MCREQTQIESVTRTLIINIKEDTKDQRWADVVPQAFNLWAREADRATAYVFKDRPVSIVMLRPVYTVRPYLKNTHNTNTRHGNMMPTVEKMGF